MDTGTLIFEAAVSANEEEADFIPVSITNGFSCTCRTTGGSGGCGGSRVAVGGLLGRPWHLHWQHCRRYSNSRRLSLLLTHDDEFISVDSRKV